MIEQVLHPYNVQCALKQVIANKGSAGVDGIKVRNLTDCFRKAQAQLYSSIREMKYFAQPILGVDIPKGNGKTRLLGIPTVTDRVLQQAVSQVLMPKYESEFSVHSYGFRPNKSARQAVGKALANILLNELDKELTRRNLRFVRYADDFSIYTKYKSHATATLKAIEKFLKTKLKLTINREKSGVRKPVQFELLGFGFESTYKKGDKGKYQLVVGKKAWERLKQRLKFITRKTTPKSFDERIQQINEVQRGWLNYFRGTSIKGKLKKLDGWLRNRLRYCIWHHWKKPERKRKNLIRLGVDQGDAYAFSRSRKGGWAIAQSPILGTTITISRLKRRGYISMLELHLSLNPSRYEPPYMQLNKMTECHLCKLGACSRTYGGVRA